MNEAEALALFSGAVKLVEHIPAMAEALAELVHAVRTEQDLTPAVKHAEVVAAKAYLGI